jgi:hypothetical protein
MSVVRSPSSPPAPLCRPKSLTLDGSRTAASFRAGEVARGFRVRAPARHEARLRGAASLQAATRAMSLPELALCLGVTSDRVAAEVLSGQRVISAGEVADLLPTDVATRHFVDVLRGRYQRELARQDLPEQLRLRLRLALTHLDALLVVGSGDAA